MIIVIKNALTISGDENVGPAIVVVVTDGDPHPEGCTEDSGLLGDVGEGSVAIVFIEGVADGLSGLPEVARTAVHQKDVHPSVVIKIQKCTAWAERFRKV